MKIKRLIAVFIALLLLLGTLPTAALAAVGAGWDDDCRGNPSGDGYGKHKWVKEWEDPTGCTTPMYVGYTCAYCGASTSREAKAPGHKWGSWQTVKEATCTQNGQQTRKCSVCGETEKRTTDKGAHSWGAWTVTQEATCTATGARERKCQACGEVQKETIAKTEHAWGDWVVVIPAGDFSMGKRSHSCKVCTLSATEDYYPDPTYKRGDRGDGVKALQEGLNAAGYDCGTADGVFGGKTEAAVQALETANGVDADGIAWPGVIKLLGLAGAKGPDEELPDASGFGGDGLILNVEIVPPKQLDYKVGDKVTFKWTLTNIGPKDLTLDALIADPTLDGDGWTDICATPLLLPAGGEEPVSDKYIMELDESWKKEFGPFTLNFIASGHDDKSEYVQSNPVEIMLPSTDSDVINWLRLEVKQVSPSKESYELGDEITYQWTLSNNGPMDCELDFVFVAGKEPLYNVYDGPYTLLADKENDLSDTCTLKVDEGWSSWDDAWRIDFAAEGHPVIKLDDDRPFRSNGVRFEYGAGETAPVEEEPPELGLDVKPETDVTVFHEGETVKFKATIRNNTEKTLTNAVIWPYDGQGKHRLAYDAGTLEPHEEKTFDDEYTFTADDVAHSPITLTWDAEAVKDGKVGFGAPPVAMTYTVLAEGDESVPALVLMVTPKSGKTDVTSGDDVEFVLHVHNPGKTDLTDACVRAYDGSGGLREEYLDIDLPAGGNVDLDDHYTFTDDDASLHDITLLWQGYTSGSATEPAAEKGIDYTVSGLETEAGVPKLVLEVTQTSPAKERYAVDEIVDFDWKLTNTGDVPCTVKYVVVTHGESGWTGILWNEEYVLQPNAGNELSDSVGIPMILEHFAEGKWREEFEAGAFVEDDPEYYYTAEHVVYEFFPEDGADIVEEPQLVLEVTQTSPAKEDGYEEDDEVAFHWTLTNNGDEDCELDMLTVYTPEDAVRIVSDKPLKLSANGADPQSGDYTLPLTGDWVNDISGQWEFAFRAQAKPAGSGIRSNEVSFVLAHAGDEPVPYLSLYVTQEEPVAIVHEGDTVHFQLELANNVEETLYDPVISPHDGQGKARGDFSDSQLPGYGAFTPKDMYTFTEQDAQSSPVTLCWTGKARNADGETVESEPVYLKYEIVPLESVSVTKSVVGSPADEAGYQKDEVIHYEITVTNNTGETITDVEVYDPLKGSSEDMLVDLFPEIAPGKSETAKFDYTVTGPDVINGYVENTASARWTEGNENRDKDSNTVRVDTWGRPDAEAFTVVKRIVSGPGPYAVSETIKFEIDVTNNTGETVDYVPVYDFLNGDTEGVPVETIHGMTPGETRTVEFEYTVQPEDLAAGKVVNVAGVRIDKGEKEEPDEYKSDPVEALLTQVPPRQEDAPVITKSVTNMPARGFFLEDEVIKFEITVENPTKDTYFYKLDIDEPLKPGMDKSLGEVGVLGPGDTVTKYFEYTVADWNVSDTYVINQAAVYYETEDGLEDVRLSNIVEVPTGVLPDDETARASVSKKATSHPGNGKYYVKGETITYEIIVRNSGNVKLDEVIVYDTLKDGTGEIASIENFYPSDTRTYTFTHTVTDGDVDAKKVINRAWIAWTRGNEAGTAWSDPVVSPCGKPGEPTPKAEADCCVRTLTGLGEGLAEFTLDYCAEHKPVNDKVAALVAAAQTDEEKLEAWQEAVRLWTEALNAEYDGLLAAASEAEKPILITERTLFFAQLASRQDALKQEHSDDPALVAMLVSEQLMNRTADLCYELHTAPEARVDSRLREGIAELEPMDAPERCLRDVEATGTGARYLENLCQAERICEIEAAALIEAATPETLAEAWYEVARLWRMKLDAWTNERYQAADAEARDAIVAERVSFGKWLKEREAFLNLMYPDRPEIVNEVIAQTIRARVIDLCVDGE